MLLSLLPGLLFAAEKGSVNSAKSNIELAGERTIKIGFADLEGIPAAARATLPRQMMPADAYGSGYIDFYGTTALSVSGGIANISIDGIHNSSSTYTSGSLKIELWALQVPYYGGSVTGYVTASIRTNQINGASDSLGPGESFTNISLHLPFTAPGNSSYDQYAVFLEEYDSSCSSSDHFCITAVVNLQSQQQGNPPACSPTVSPSHLPSSGGNVSASANCTNSPTSYSWTVNGTYQTSNANFSVTVPPNNSSSAVTYTFTVSAANSYGSGSGSASVVVDGGQSVSYVDPPAPNYSACVRSATTSCLLNGRFRVEANWQSAPGGQGGPTSVTYFSGGRAETDNAAVLYFQSPLFFEIGATLYNGCLYGSSNTWVFISGLTDWSWAMTISDTLHHTYKQYYNPYHNVTQTTTDYYAFSCN